MMRKKCMECPWREEASDTDVKWQEHVKENVIAGYIDTVLHRCHMINNDSFDYNEETNTGKSVSCNDKEVCIGSLEEFKK